MSSPDKQQPNAFRRWTIPPSPVFHPDGVLLGEGPHYEATSNTLRFVDIRRRRLHGISLSPYSSSTPGGAGSLVLNDLPVSVTADIAGQDPLRCILVGLKLGIALLHRESGNLTYITRFSDAVRDGRSVNDNGGGGGGGGNASKTAATPTDHSRLRSNDGAVGPDGRFWIGTMTDFGHGPFRPEGSLYVFDGRTGLLSEQLTGLTIPNGIGWSLDGRTMYFVHSLAREVLAFDYDSDILVATTGEPGSAPSTLANILTNRRVFYRHEGPGEPDGTRVDAEGNLWLALFGEGSVIKVSPAGVVVGRVSVPTARPTCVEFVGEELYVTTAVDDDDYEGGEAKEEGGEDGGKAEKSLGGAVFRVRVGVKGMEKYRFALGEGGA